MALPRDAMGWSAVCDCGMSWSYSLAYFTILILALCPVICADGIGVDDIPWDYFISDSHMHVSTNCDNLSQRVVFSGSSVGVNSWFSNIRVDHRLYQLIAFKLSRQSMCVFIYFSTSVYNNEVIVC